jgi:hydrogenase-4 component B
MIVALLLCVAALFALALAAVPLATTPAARPVIYGGALAITTIGTLIALAAIAAAPTEKALPLGLPWLGAHFRLDALAAFFLLVVDLGAAAASL